MALDLTQEQKDKGKRNFEQATGELTRRGFMKSMVAGAAVVPVSAAVYFGYETWKGNKAVRTALIGGYRDDARLWAREGVEKALLDLAETDLAGGKPVPGALLIEKRVAV